MTALVVVHFQDRAGLGELPFAAVPGSVWLTDLGPVLISDAGRAIRLGRAP